MSVSSQPRLELPFAGGTAVLCTQANESPAGVPGNSHSTGNCRYALDFVCPAELDPVIRAAHAGRVSYVFADADDTLLAGQGWGNSVRVDHPDGFFTLYAHLDRITVKAEQSVECGAVLGSMGDTGNTEYRHLHFSCHSGNGMAWDGAGALPMERLRCWVPERGETELDSRSFRWSYHVVWPNRNVYVSLNGIARVDPASLVQAAHRARWCCWLRPFRWVVFRRCRRRYGIGCIRT